MTATRRALLSAASAAPLLAFAERAAAAGRDHLNFGLSGYPPNLQPWMWSGVTQRTATALMHRGLLSFAPDGTLQGELAESWGRDGEKGWTFRLREAWFHNGAPVTSADVKWSLEEIAAPGSTAYYRIEFGGIERIATPDARTVRIEMKEPTSTVPYWLGGIAPICAQAERASTPVGAGPFMLKSAERGVKLEFEAFDRYYKPGLPKLKTIRLLAIADEALRVAALQSGDVDIIELVPWQSMDGIEADPRLKLTSTDGAFMYIGFNGKAAPFNDHRVRQAIAFAVKREDIVRSVFFNRGSALGGLPIIKGAEFYDEALANHWAYDPDRARRLLAEAGLGNGFSCTLLSSSQFSMYQNSAEIVQQHLAAVGITVQLRLTDWPTFVQMATRGQYQFRLAGSTGRNNDPDSLRSMLDPTLPPSFDRSFDLPVPGLHELFEAGKAEFDRDRRFAIYQQVQRLALDQAPVVYLSWRSQAYAMRKELQGFYNLPGALSFYSGDTLEGTSLG
jgi:peptide/nickel transport system substrate-binding protein